jgi:hypothetical protein
LARLATLDGHEEKKTQWHPLFTHLLGLLVGDYYELRPEVPVSELPRRGDVLLLRRRPGEEPPFRGLWERLTEVSVLEFKGPGDGPELDDLELLVHVGTGLTYKLNEERGAKQEARLANRQVSFWYLVPQLSERFVGEARLWAAFIYQTGGLWSGQVWGHPIYLVSYRDVPVEEDTIPLHLLDRDPGAPRELGALVAGSEGLARRFAAWLSSLQPRVWEEVMHMASTPTGPRIIEWEELAKYADISGAIRAIPPDRVIQVLGADQIIQTLGPQKLLEYLLAVATPEQIQEMLHRRQQGSKPAEGPGA